MVTEKAKGNKAKMTEEETRYLKLIEEFKNNAELLSVWEEKVLDVAKHRLESGKPLAATQRAMLDALVDQEEFDWEEL